MAYITIDYIKVAPSPKVITIYEFGEDIGEGRAVVTYFVGTIKHDGEVKLDLHHLLEIGKRHFVYYNVFCRFNITICKKHEVYICVI